MINIITNYLINYSEHFLFSLFLVSLLVNTAWFYASIVALLIKEDYYITIIEGLFLAILLENVVLALLGTH